MAWAKKGNPGCGCCDEPGGICFNEDTTLFSEITISGLPTLTSGPFTIPDHNGTYMISAIEPQGTECAFDGGEIPVRLFGSVEHPSCCSYIWNNFLDSAHQAFPDCTFFGFPVTDIECWVRSWLQIRAEFQSATEVKYSVFLAWEWCRTATALGDTSTVCGYTPYSSAITRDNEIVANIAGAIVQATLTLVKGGLDHHQANACDVDDPEGDDNSDFGDEFEITLEWS